MFQVLKRYGVLGVLLSVSVGLHAQNSTNTNSQALGSDQAAQQAGQSSDWASSIATGPATPLAIRGAGAEQQGSGTSLPSAQQQRLPAPRFPRNEPNDFQKFVLEATGKLLPVFGADFFAEKEAVRPIQGSPVPNDYPLGPSDELLIRGWGSVDIDYRAVVDRNGFINIPRVGTVSLAGVRAADAEEVIRNAVSKYFRGVSLSVTLGRLRTITVYLVGQARRPGTYTLSSLSTLVTALSETGGPNQNGSLRNVQVKRAGKQIAEMDLYAFLSKGEKSGDVRLIDGDVIVIPAAAGYAALTGNVRNPAVYELREGDTLRSLLELAGGLPVLADPRRAFLERTNPANNLPRSVEEITLDTNGLSKQLNNGDLVSVLSAVPEFSNAVTLRGTVSQALRAPFRRGMKISDLIPSKEFLITKSVARRQNRALIAQERQEERILEQQFPREQRQLAQAKRTNQDSALYPTQQISDGTGMGAVQGGALVVSGDAQTSQPQPNDVEPFSNDRDLDKKSLAQSIGNTYDEINWDYAVIERPNRADLSVTLIPFNLGKALSDPASGDNVALQAGDTVTVFSADDVRVPIAKRRVFIRVEGEVAKPGVYQVNPGESLVNVLLKAGGLTKDAYLYGAEFYRDSVRKAQQENLDKFVRRLEQQMLSDARRSLANRSTDASAVQAVQAQAAIETESRNRFIQKLRELKASGRIALNISPKDESLAQIPDFRLENGDRLVVPNRPDFVQVFGAVNTESALLWQSGRSVSDYLEQSGVASSADTDAVFVLHASGTVLSNSGRWFSSVKGAEVFPGDIIVMPEKVELESGWTTFVRGAKDITQVFANLGIGAAAIKTLRQ